jgi:hypothetical protein
MKTILILVGVGLFIFFLAKVKKNHKKVAIGQRDNEFKSKINELYFPDRVDAIKWHIAAIDRGFKNGDFGLVNLSYAKLIESIRQQNENEKGNYEDVLKTIKNEYTKFRNVYGFEYPEQFLPPAERRFKSTSSKLDSSSKNKKRDYTSYLIIDGNAIRDMKALFDLAGNSDGFNRDFWITDKGKSTLLAKVLSVYSFELDTKNFRLLINKANRFIKQMRIEAPDYWNEFPLYNIVDLNESYPINITTDILTKLQYLSVSERLYFFDISGDYWTSQSSHKTRSIGLDEKSALSKFVKLGFFSESKDLESIPGIVGKRELKEFADKCEFELKKSWTVEKMFDYAMATEKGREFLRSFLDTKQVWKFNSIYKEDFNAIVARQEKIKKVADLICMV